MSPGRLIRTVRIILLLYSGSVLTETPVAYDELEAERGRVEMESEQLQEQIRAGQAQLEKLQAMIEALRQRSKEVDRKLQALMQQVPPDLSDKGSVPEADPQGPAR